ncbi:MAG: hypothetical protein ACE5KE_07950 [Methanosarcinales archaeon]
MCTNIEKQFIQDLLSLNLGPIPEITFGRSLYPRMPFSEPWPYSRNYFWKVAFIQEWLYLNLGIIPELHRIAIY